MSPRIASGDLHPHHVGAVVGEDAGGAWPDGTVRAVDDPETIERTGSRHVTRPGSGVGGGADRLEGAVPQDRQERAEHRFTVASAQRVELDQPARRRVQELGHPLDGDAPPQAAACGQPDELLGRGGERPSLAVGGADAEAGVAQRVGAELELQQDVVDPAGVVHLLPLGRVGGRVDGERLGRQVPIHVGGEQLLVVPVEDREEEVLLGVEVEVDRAPGEARGGRDLVERRGHEAFAGEDLGRGGDQRGARELPAPFRREAIDGHVAGPYIVDAPPGPGAADPNLRMSMQHTKAYVKPFEPDGSARHSTASHRGAKKGRPLRHSRLACHRD